MLLQHHNKSQWSNGNLKVMVYFRSTNVSYTVEHRFFLFLFLKSLWKKINKKKYRYVIAAYTVPSYFEHWQNILYTSFVERFFYIPRLLLYWFNLLCSLSSNLGKNSLDNANARRTWMATSITRTQHISSGVESENCNIGT